jgi:hypothetical protein
MADRLEEVIDAQLAHMRKALAMMETGVMKTRTSNVDTTQESIDEHRVWIGELEAALSFHRQRRA